MKKAFALILSVLMVFSLVVIGFAAGITKDQAKKAAVDAVNAQYNTSYTVESVIFERIDRAEFEDDYLKTVYDVEFYVDNGDGTYKKYDCDIDAETGALLGYIDYEITRELDDVPGNFSIGAIFDQIKAFITRIIDFIKGLFVK